MKTINELEKEYKEYQPSKIQMEMLQTPEELATYIQVGIDDTVSIEKELENEMRENKRWQISGKIRNLFFFIFQEEEISFYDYDNEILQEGIELTLKHRDFYTRVISIISNDNFKELIKLIGFGTDYYNSNIEYLDSKRDSLEYSYKGFNYVNSKCEDTREIVIEFLNRKINELSTNKAVEKSKKIC